MNQIKSSFFFKNIPSDLTSLFEEEPWKLFQGGLKKFFLNSKNCLEGKISPKAELEGKGIHIEKGAVVEAYSYIKGPCFIGAGTEVRHGAYLRGNVYVSPNCVVGHSTEVKHSVFFEGAKAGHFNYIGDSILGSQVNLGAGTKLANLKITNGNIILKTEDGPIDTGLRKLGAILGDSCETGCNSVLNPGTLMAQRSLVFPNATAKGLYLNRSVIK